MTSKMTASRYMGLPCSKCEGCLRYRKSNNCVACHLAQKRKETEIIESDPCPECGGTKWYAARTRWCVGCQYKSYTKRGSDLVRETEATGLGKLLSRKF